MIADDAIVSLNRGESACDEAVIESQWTLFTDEQHKRSGKAYAITSAVFLHIGTAHKRVRRNGKQMAVCESDS